MGKKVLKNNKKGQVFLLLSIVILIYLVLLSTTVYKITQSPYISPAPNQDQITFYVENSIGSIEDLTNVAISRLSNGDSLPDIINLMYTGLAEIETFLDNHNLPSTITFDNTTFSLSNSSTTINPVLIACTFEVFLHIESPDFYYDSTFIFSIAYYLEISDTIGTENHIYIYEINNGFRTIINDAIVTITPSTPVSNLLDGRYEADLETGQMISAVLPGNILLWLEV